MLSLGVIMTLSESKVRAIAAPAAPAQGDSSTGGQAEAEAPAPPPTLLYPDFVQGFCDDSDDARRVQSHLVVDLSEECVKMHAASLVPSAPQSLPDTVCSPFSLPPSCPLLSPFPIFLLLTCLARPPARLSALREL